MDIQLSYSGANAERQYAPMAVLVAKTFEAAASRGFKHGWDPNTNTLNAILLNPKDVDPEGAYKSKDWSDSGGCNPPHTRNSVDVGSYLEDQTRNLYQIIRGAVQKDPESSGAFLFTANENPFLLADTIRQIASANLRQIESLHYLPLMSGEKELPWVAVSLRDSEQTLDMVANLFSHLGLEYYKGLNFTPKAARVFTVTHELGHAYRKHISGSNPYPCLQITYDDADTRSKEEAEADVMGMHGLDTAVQLGFLSANEGEGAKQAMEVFRTFGNFFQSPNVYTLENSSLLNDHMTTVFFSSRTKDYHSQFNESSHLRGYTSLPVVVNSLADILSGFLYAKEMAQAIRATPKYFSPEARKEIREMGKSLVGNEKSLALLGTKVRFGANEGDGIPEIMRQPEYYMAAMYYIRETGGFQHIRARLRYDLREVFDDFINDFFWASDNHGSPELVRQDLIQRFRNMFKHKPDYVQITKAIMNQGREIPNDLRAGDPPIPAYILRPSWF